MMRKSIRRIALALLTVFALTGALNAFAEPAGREATTTATVSFGEGYLEFGTVGPDEDMDNMDLDFGAHTLPTGAVTYGAESDPLYHSGVYTLRVLDGRSNAGGWSVQVKLDQFKTGDNPDHPEFSGNIAMTGATSSSAGLTPTASIVVAGAAGGGSAVTVVNAGTLTNGTYDTTWIESNISLSVSQANASLITKPASYEAELTWSLLTI